MGAVKFTDTELIDTDIPSIMRSAKPYFLLLKFIKTSLLSSHINNFTGIRNSNHDNT